MLGEVNRLCGYGAVTTAPFFCLAIIRLFRYGTSRTPSHTSLVYIRMERAFPSRFPFALNPSPALILFKKNVKFSPFDLQAAYNMV